jgi:copper(I)-binding protein
MRSATWWLLVVLVAACGDNAGASQPLVVDVRIGQPTGPNAAMYFLADGYGTEDVLVGATTEVATEVRIHQTMISDDGTMGMQPIDGLDLPADGELVLEPGGFHLMLLDAERLEIGDVVEVVLQWGVAGDQTVQAEVVDPGATMDHEAGG